MGHRERDISTELIEVVTGRETSTHFGEVEFTSTESESEAETFHKKEWVAKGIATRNQRKEGVTGSCLGIWVL